MRRKEKNENSRIRGEQPAVAAFGAGRKVSVAAGAAGGSRCSPGQAGAKTEKRGGLKERRYCVCVPWGRGMTAEIK